MMHNDRLADKLVVGWEQNVDPFSVGLKRRYLVLCFDFEASSYDTTNSHSGSISYVPST
jgi:hypothetical protein